ncbi:TPA: hypothetical protein ACIVFE_001569, partial [Salmonella enterica subsp. diarizonae serovar 50:k:z35]
FLIPIYSGLLIIEVKTPPLSGFSSTFQLNTGKPFPLNGLETIQHLVITEFYDNHFQTIPQKTSSK